MTRQIIALLGRRDVPTDAVEEYCRNLAHALQQHGMNLELHRVAWEVHGWNAALAALRKQSMEWENRWVAVQYTALAWSARGFPNRFSSLIRTLKSSGAKIAVVFHDVEPYSSPRPIDQARRLVQRRAMRQATRLADVAIFTVAPEVLSWLKPVPANAVFIPVGPNLPFAEFSPQKGSEDIPTIGVFGITGGEQGARETQVIRDAVRHAGKKIGALRLSVFGRHAELREADLREGLRDSPVQVSVEGVLAQEEVVARLTACTVLLFVRNGISSRRSSAIAGIAAGLPIVAYRNSETAAPVTDAGVMLVDPKRPEELHDALVRVLSEPGLREELAERSRKACQEHFQWRAIADRFADIFNKE